MKTVKENKEFIDAMIETVNEFGRDYVFEGPCCYFDRHLMQPLCLIGQALAKVGVDAHSFFAIKREFGRSYNDVEAGVTLLEMGYHPIVVTAAAKAQTVQDGRLTIDGSRGTWGDAIDVFVKNLNDSRIMHFVPEST